MIDVVVIGSFVQDLAFRTEVFPNPGETRIGTFHAGPGGKGFNQAVASHRLGINTLFVGAVGRDIFADILRNFAEAEGLSLHLQLESEYSTGAASIVVNSTGQNLIVVSLGANDALSEEHVAGVETKIASSKVVLLQLESNINAANRALELARKHGVLSLLNPAPINNKVTPELIRRADIIIPNETEFVFLLKKFFNITIDQEVADLSDHELHALSNRFGVSGVVVTLGESGSFVSHNPEFPNNRSPSSGLSCFRVPVHPVKSIDTTGAGDSFCGALSAGLARYNFDFEKAIRLATISAALSTEKVGTAPAMPYRDEVDQLFAKINKE